MRHRLENEAPKKKAFRHHFLSISVDLDPFSGGQNRRKRVPERDPKKSVFSVAKKTEKSENSSQTPIKKAKFLKTRILRERTAEGPRPAEGKGGIQGPPRPDISYDSEHFDQDPESRPSALQAAANFPGLGGSPTTPKRTL